MDQSKEVTISMHRMYEHSSQNNPQTRVLEAQSISSEVGVPYGN